jgi:uncharacterized protein (TIGR03083 family)
MVSDRQEVYGQLHEARKELLAAVDGLKPDQMTVPMLGDWSVKDILAHVASWEEFALPDLRRAAKGRMPALASFREAEVDDWNRALMSLRRNFPLDQVMGELEEYREATMAALDAVPDERFGQFPSIMAQITVRHDRDHAADIVKWREKEGLK